MAMVVADIGGTFARFGVAEGSFPPQLRHSVTVPTAAAPHLAGLLAAAFGAGLGVSVHEAERVVLAVAGAVRDGRAWLPNVGLTVDAQDPCLAGRAVVVNDFVAQAYATLHPEVVASWVLLQPGQEALGPRVVLGAGTGFGACILVPGQGQWTALPTEMGHIPFPFTPEEAGFADVVRGRTPEPIVDAVVSGPGLARLHAWLIGASREADPAELTHHLTPDHPTTQTFARLYGRVARIAALLCLPYAGVYLAGGVAARCPILVEHPAFVEEFVRCTGYESLLARIPVRRITHPQAGLLGAAVVGEVFHGES
jgi:glucokinase